MKLGTFSDKICPPNPVNLFGILSNHRGLRNRPYPNTQRVFFYFAGRGSENLNEWSWEAVLWILHS